MLFNFSNPTSLNEADRNFTNEPTAVELRARVHSIESIADSSMLCPITRNQKIEEAYKVFSRVFATDPEELDPVDVVKELVAEGYGNTSLDILVARNHANEIVGVAQVMHSSGKHSYGVLELAAVPKELRGQGIGFYLLKQFISREREHGSSVVFVEVDDPRLMSSLDIREQTEASTSPTNRLRFYSKAGMMALDAPYAQPPTKVGGEIVTKCMIIGLPLTSEFENGLPIEAYREIMLEFADTYDGIEGNVEESAWGKAFINAISAMESAEDFISWKPLLRVDVM